MKSLILFAVLVGYSQMRAAEKEFEYKNWKTFRSDYGFEFKYPECWSLDAGDIDEQVPIGTFSKEIAMHEGNECKRILFYAPYQNSINISVARMLLKTRDEIIKKLARSEKGADMVIIRDDWKIYKRLKFEGGGEAFIYVTNHNNVSYKWIRWEMNLYCGLQEIRIVGPAIKNPDEALLKKFKAGDVGLPEPEKTIYESIKCIEPKIKPPAEKLKK